MYVQTVYESNNGCRVCDVCFRADSANLTKHNPSRFASERKHPEFSADLLGPIVVASDRVCAYRLDHAKSGRDKHDYSGAKHDNTRHSGPERCDTKHSGPKCYTKCDTKLGRAGFDHSRRPKLSRRVNGR
jgi:hypothetical protein